MSTVGNHIRKLRKQKNISQEELAKELNVTRQAVSQWERNKTQPDISLLTKISDILETDIHEVIYGKSLTVRSRMTSVQRKKYIRGAIIFGLIALIIGTISLIFKLSWPKESWPMMPKWYIDHYNIYWFFAIPIFYINISLAILSGVSLFWDIRIRSIVIRNILLIVAISILLMYLGILVFHNILFIRLLMFSSENRIIFLIPGIALFLGLNSYNNKEKTQ